MLLDGMKIKNLRRTNQWTQKELATSVMKDKGLKELSFRTIQRIEQEADYRCSKQVIGSLATAFDVKETELLLPIDSPEISVPEKPKTASLEEALISSNHIHTEHTYETKEFYLDEKLLRFIAGEIELKSDELNFLRNLKFRLLKFDILIEKSRLLYN